MGALIDSLLAAPPPATSEPDWLAPLRAGALAALRTHGLPAARAEAWKYTSLRALDARRFEATDPAARDHAVAPELLDLPGAEGPRLVFVNGALRADLSTLAALPAGLELVPLSRALATGDAAARVALAPRAGAPDDAFAQLNTALAREGALLRVAPGVRIDAPVQLLHLGVAGAADVAWHLRHRIELGAGSALCLIERHAGAGHAHLGNVALAADIGAGASLQLLQLQEAAEASSLIRRSDLSLAAGARVDATALEFGAALSRHDVLVRLDGREAHFASRGCFALRSRQHGDTRLDVRHEVPDTRCDLLWRGVADQRARGVFRGAITIAAGADGSAAALSNKNLLLSPQAEIDTQPVLEIYADAVQASHGATVGQLDERALFYLRSRGVPAAQARAMLTLAFCAEVLDAIAAPALREHLAGRLQAQLPPAAEA